MKTEICVPLLSRTLKKLIKLMALFKFPGWQLVESASRKPVPMLLYRVWYSHCADLQVNADKIYTSKEFKRIKDNFQVGQAIVLYCYVLNCTILHCTALYGTVM